MSPSKVMMLACLLARSFLDKDVQFLPPMVKNTLAYCKKSVAWKDICHSALENVLNNVNDLLREPDSTLERFKRLAPALSKLAPLSSKLF